MVFISNNQTTEVLQPGEQSFIEVEVATRSKVFGERLQHATQVAFADPLLEPAMASLVRGETVRANLPTEFHFSKPRGCHL